MARRLTEWAGRGVLITGGSAGIGRALAIALAARGARLALLARRADALDEVVAACGDAEVHRFVCDVADAASQRSAFEAARAALGTVDVGVLNAGVGLHRRFLEHDEAATRRLFEVNVLGAIDGARRLATPMADGDGGWLVFMASIAGLLPVPGEAVYSATKHALLGFADALSIELEPRGVHVMSVCPGAVDTHFVPPDERHRIPKSARAATCSAEEVAEATIDGLRRGLHRVVVPRRLSVAVAARGVSPALVRSGTKRATRDVR